MDSSVIFLKGSSTLQIQEYLTNFDNEMNLLGQSIKEYSMSQIIELLMTKAVKLAQTQSNLNGDMQERINNQFEIARNQFLQQKFTESQQSYSLEQMDQGIHIDQNELQYNQGLVLLEQGKTEAAMKLFQQIISQKEVKDTIFQSAQLAASICQIKLGNIAEAQQLFKDNNNDQKKPQTEYLLLQGFAFLEQGKYQEAHTNYRKLEAIENLKDYEKALCYNGKGVAKFKLEMIRESIEDFALAVKSDGSEYLYKYNLIYSKLKLNFDDKNTLKVCLDMATTCLKQEGKDRYEMYNLLGNIQTKLGDFENALQYQKLACKLLQQQIEDQKEGVYQQNMKLLLRDKLFILVNKAINLFNLLKRNKAFFNTEQYKECEQCCLEGIELQRSNKNIVHSKQCLHYFYNILSTIYLYRKDYENAIQYLDFQIPFLSEQYNSSSLAGGLECCYLNKAFALIHLKKFREAEGQLKEIRSSQTTYSLYMQFYLSEIYIQQEQYPLAIETLEKLQQTDLQNSNLKYQVEVQKGIAHLLSDSLKEAWEELIPLKKTLLSDPAYYEVAQTTNYRYYLSVLYFKLNLLQKSIQVLGFTETAKNLVENIIEYEAPTFHLAQCFARHGYKKAESYFQKAIKDIESKLSESQSENEKRFLKYELAYIYLHFSEYKKDICFIPNKDQNIKGFDQNLIKECTKYYEKSVEFNKEALFYYGMFLFNIQRYELSLTTLEKYIENCSNNQRREATYKIIAMLHYEQGNYNALVSYMQQHLGLFPNQQTLEFKRSYSNSINQCKYAKYDTLFDLALKKYSGNDNGDQAEIHSKNQPLKLVFQKIEANIQIAIVLNELDYASNIFGELIRLPSCSIGEHNQIQRNSSKTLEKSESYQSNSSDAFNSLPGDIELSASQSNGSHLSSSLSLNGQQSSKSQQTLNILSFIFNSSFKKFIYINMQFFLNMFPYKIVHNIYDLYQDFFSLNASSSDQQQFSKNKCLLKLCLRIVEVIQLFQQLKIPNPHYINWTTLMLEYKFWNLGKHSFNLEPESFNMFNSLHLTSLLEKDIYSVICFLSQFILQKIIEPSDTLKDFCSEAVHSTNQTPYCKRFKLQLQIELMGYSQIDNEKQSDQDQNKKHLNSFVKRITSAYLKYTIGKQLNLDSRIQPNLEEIEKKLKVPIQFTKEMEEYISSNFATFLIDLSSSDSSQRNIEYTLKKYLFEQQKANRNYQKYYLQAEREFQLEKKIKDWRAYYIESKVQNKENLETFARQEWMMQHQETDLKVQQFLYVALNKIEKTESSILNQVEQNDDLKLLSKLYYSLDFLLFFFH